MRLVDADEAKAKVRSTFDMQDLYLPYRFQNMLDEMPTVDAVEVVRCKDCRYYDAENHNCLDEMAYARIWNEDDYCSFAERREER